MTYFIQTVRFVIFFKRFGEIVSKIDSSSSAANSLSTVNNIRRALQHADISPKAIDGALSPDLREGQKITGLSARKCTLLNLTLPVFDIHLFRSYAYVILSVSMVCWGRGAIGMEGATTSAFILWVVS